MEAFYSRRHLPDFDEVHTLYANADGAADAEQHAQWRERYFHDARSGGYLDRGMLRQRLRLSVELFLCASD